jgi:hypothetical protein
LPEEKEIMEQSPVQSLRNRVDEAITKSGGEVVEQVHTIFVQAEINRRADLIVKGINTLREAEADLKKINRADHILYDAEGQPTPGFYSKGRIDEIKKARGHIDKIEAALNKCIGYIEQSETVSTIQPNADDFNKLEQVLKSKE